MKALDQIQEIIQSLQTVKAKLALIVSSQQIDSKPQDQWDFCEKILLEITLHTQNYNDSFKSSFLSIVNNQFDQYEQKSGQKLIFDKKFGFNQKGKNTIVGEDLRLMKTYLGTGSEEKQVDQILLPQFKEELNRSMGTIGQYKAFKGSENKSQSSSFYTVIQGENFKDIKMKYLHSKDLETGSVREDNVRERILDRQSLEKFESFGDRSSSPTSVKVKKTEKQTQTIRKSFGLQKTQVVTIEQIANLNSSLKKSKKSSKQNQSALLEIIYGKELLPFIHFYHKETKKNQTNSESPYQSNFIDNNYDLQQRYNKEDENQLIKYLTKGNSPEEINSNEVMQAKFQRLVVICLDTLLHTMKIMEYFLPGSLDNIISTIQQEELTTLKSNCLGSREQEIEKVCKKVSKKMMELKTKLSLYDAKGLIFNKENNIKVILRAKKQE